MTEREKFLGILALFTEMSGKPFSSALADVYWRALQPYTDGQVGKAVSEGITKWDCFGFGRNPSVADIVALIQGEPEEQALTAWMTLEDAIRSVGAYQSVQFTDAKIGHVVTALGGWIQVCRWRVDEMHFRRSEFMRLYAAAPEMCEAKMLPGIITTENSGMGYFDAVPEPIVIGQPKGQLQIEETK